MNVEAAKVLPVKAFMNASAAARHELNLSHVELSPYAHEVEQATIEWMQASRLLPDTRCLEKAKAMAIWGYAGFSHPFGNVEELTLYSKFITLWLLWDDLVVEKTDDLSSIFKGVTQAFRCDSDLSSERDPYMRAWRSIADGYRSLGVSSEFVHRLGRKMGIWVQTVERESASVRAAGKVNPWSHLRRRLITIGVPPTAQLLDLHVRDVDRLRAAQRVVLTGAAVVALVNELVCVEKDMDYVNLVALVQNWYQCDFESAYSRVVDLCRLSVTKLAAAVEALPTGLQAWGTLVRYMSEGFAYWHFVCSRYNGERIHCRVARDAVEDRPACAS